MCSPSWSLLPPPSPSHPSGSSQCTSPEHLSHASNLGWWSVSPFIVYLFQCCSLRTSHPCLLPQKYWEYLGVLKVNGNRNSVRNHARIVLTCRSFIQFFKMIFHQIFQSNTLNKIDCLPVLLKPKFLRILSFWNDFLPCVIYWNHDPNSPLD